VCLVLTIGQNVMYVDDDHGLFNATFSIFPIVLHQSCLGPKCLHIPFFKNLGCSRST